MKRSHSVRHIPFSLIKKHILVPDWLAHTSKFTCNKHTNIHYAQYLIKMFVMQVYITAILQVNCKGTI
mgnify:FL=1